MFVCNRYENFRNDADAIAQVTRGRIIMRAGRLDSIEQHWLRSPTSIAQVWWESNHGRLRGDVCMLDYHVPSGLPNFLTLDYIRSGNETSYRTFIGAAHLLNDIAALRGSDAIVAHVTNVKLTDRFMHRLGWQRHQEHWRGRHFIRRFYDGYPAPTVGRYAP